VYQHSPTESLQNDALNLTTGTPVLRKGKTIDTSNSLCMEEHGRTVCVVEILLTSMGGRAFQNLGAGTSSTGILRRNFTSFSVL